MILFQFRFWCAVNGGAFRDALGGYRLLPWTRRGDGRDEIERLSGQKDVPILVLDDGEVISGTGTIRQWAKEHPAAGR